MDGKKQHSQLVRMEAEERKFLVNRFRRLKDVPFDASQLHWFLREYLENVRQTTDAKPETLITALLPAIMANIGNKVFLQVGYRRHFGNIWAIIIGPSTIGRKSTALHLACAALTAYNTQLRQKYDQEVEAWKLLDEGERKTTPPPVREFAIYPSCPAEQFLPVVGKNPNGLLMYSEIADFLSKMGKSYNADFKSMITAMFDGDRAERATRTYGVEGVEHPAFSIATATTREWFLKELDREQDVNSGFLQRFLVCNSYDIDFDALNFEFREGGRTSSFLNERVTRLFAALRAFGTEAEPVEIHLSADVKAMYAQEYRAQLKPYFDKDDSRMYSYVGRLFEDYFFRLCLMFALLDFVEGKTSVDPIMVTADHGRQAHYLCKFYLKNVEGFLNDEVSATIEERNEKAIVKHLRKHEGATVSHTMLKALTHLGQQDFSSAMGELIETGVVDVFRYMKKNNKPALYYKLTIEAAGERA